MLTGEMLKVKATFSIGGDSMAAHAPLK